MSLQESSTQLYAMRLSLAAGVALLASLVPKASALPTITCQPGPDIGPPTTGEATEFALIVRTFPTNTYLPYSPVC
jgi:hypothetical protein